MSRKRGLISGGTLEVEVRPGRQGGADERRLARLPGAEDCDCREPAEQAPQGGEEGAGYHVCILELRPLFCERPEGRPRKEGPKGGLILSQASLRGLGHVLNWLAMGSSAVRSRVMRTMRTIFRVTNSASIMDAPRQVAAPRAGAPARDTGGGPGSASP